MVFFLVVIVSILMGFGWCRLLLRCSDVFIVMFMLFLVRLVFSGRIGVVVIVVVSVVVLIFSVREVDDWSGVFGC